MTTDRSLERMKQLIDSINNQNYREHAAIVQQFAEMGETAVDFLAAELTNAAIDKRGVIAWALAKLHDSRAIEPLLERADPWTVNLIYGQLIELGQPAVEPLIEVLVDKNAYKRAVSAAVLGKLKDNRAIEPLRKLLGDTALIGDNSPVTIAVLALQSLRELGAATAADEEQAHQAQQIAINKPTRQSGS